VLEFIKTLHQDEINRIQTINLNESAENVKAGTAMIKVKLVTLSLFYNLPTNITEAQKAKEVNDLKQASFARAQESGGIN
jgi:hypothetical protein